MQCAASPVRSAQTAPHPGLARVLTRHFTKCWAAPLHAPSLAMFARLDAVQSGSSAPLLLDSGCGTGESSLRLARLFPGHLVIGIDQSAARLRRLAPDGFAVHGNCILVRAELGSFWRLFNARGLKADQHWLLYPNPWPRTLHLKRRWHGHPVFPSLLATTSRIELRSNWRLYLEEFDLALAYTRCWRTHIEALPGAEPISPFERKYLAAGQALWRLSGERCDQSMPGA